MIVTTTHAIDGHTVTKYLGVVTGEAILGANVIKDIGAGIRDFIGGRSGMYENELRNARETAIHEMVSAAQDLGATAVIGVDLDYETLGQGGGMLMVTAAGTAVKL